MPDCSDHFVQSGLNSIIIIARFVTLRYVTELKKLPLQGVGGSYLHLKAIRKPQALRLQLGSTLLQNREGQQYLTKCEVVSNPTPTMK